MYMHRQSKAVQRSKLGKFQGLSVVGEIKGDERESQVPCLEEG